MIIVKNRELLVPNNERYIGTTYDNDTENRVFQVPRFSQRGVDLANLTFRLDIQYANESYDTVVLDKEVGEAFVILIWRITSATLQVPGTLYIGLRAIDDEATVKWSSFSAAMYAERHLNTPGNYGGSLTEIEQMEQDHQYMKGVVDELKSHLDYTHEAEAWAIGKRDGEDVPSTDETYHNNSKYYSEQAGASATAAANSATAAAGSATQAAETVADTNTRFNNAMAAVTSETEVIDARVGADGTTYPVLKSRLDAEHTDVKSAFSEYVEMLGERTTQLLNYVEAEIINGFANNGAIILANPARSAIIPVNVIASSTITITRKIITSRFIVSSHTTKPEIGTSAVNTVTNNGGASLQIPVDSSIKYLCLYFYNTGSDSTLDETECLKSIMVNVGDYDGFENYFIPDVADRSITGGKLASELEDAIDAIASATAEPSEIKQLTITGVQSLTWTEGYYYNTTTGQKQTAPNLAHSQKIAVNYNDTFFITNHAGSVLFYDAYDTYLGYVNTKYNATVAFGAISGASYIILNCVNLSYKASTMDLVLSGEVVSNVLTQNNDAEIGLVYDASYFVATRYVNTATGVINSISNFYGTAPLAIKPSHKYRIAKQSQIVYFDEKMVYLNSVVPTPINIESELDVTTPATAHYMAVNSLFADNAIYDLEYVPVLKTERKLDEKTVVCFGDSIIGNYAYGDNIPYQIEKHTGAKVYNVGFGGCRMENLVNDPQHTNYFSMVGIVDALESGDWTNQDTYASSIGAMVAKRLEVLKSIDFNDVDIVTIEYGTNEYGYTQEDPEDPYNVYTYGGAIRYSIEKLLELYPQIKICFFTPIYRYFPESSDDSDTHEHPTMHGKLTDNVATMKSVANEYKLPCVDMYYTGGINKYNWTHYLNMDGTHPNSDGRKLLGCRYAGELNRFF